MVGAGPEQTIDDRHDSSYRFAAGLVIGMACGSILALLFAPKAGVELRGDINTRTRSMRDSVGHRYRDIADKASAGMEQMKEKAQNFRQKAQGVAADARDVVQSKVQQAANAVEQSSQH